ncbi:MAG: hypothetical protein KZQ66_05275 [Candidatus Thiodiazotropha sp. (ex Lucinoma aequizonata)]|nr:hypothetical protein [Candidatus Thiodiazotropha sp. (ex Lucinoma aequizonata)]MCU7886877.1 hypothetical protein [Candidatus Thiodiazotropha sp. (ex Lucinoma aequizonata)]MCU7893816.1 hypothetical protein [Candidatus Thiodiazotropha sp. (ex Lucinoma aequizonata)]MCU7899705.1 hypothetical protein [Candidatus Thiodiazotropha sp. (ex Lucinoma aequizonata)]MCU7901475.1 hypothetical protein [Candidatus Thiodiazotropha sp. (ex Lucinoma aequizonata)]
MMNTNGLIRQYFPKGTDFNKVSDEQIEQVMDRLNNRPRRTRGGQSPNELFMGAASGLNRYVIELHLLLETAYVYFLASGKHW